MVSEMRRSGGKEIGSNPLALRETSFSSIRLWHPWRVLRIILQPLSCVCGVEEMYPSCDGRASWRLIALTCYGAIVPARSAEGAIAAVHQGDCQRPSDLRRLKSSGKTRRFASDRRLSRDAVQLCLRTEPQAAGG
jgi:hypothetical protein